MSTSNFKIRIDDKLRAEVTHILAGYGLSPTQAIKLFFNQVVATRKVPLSFDFQAIEDKSSHTPNHITQQTMLEARSGVGLDRYQTIEEALAAMQEIVNAKN